MNMALYGSDLHPRRITAVLEEQLDRRAAIRLSGPRTSGKTTACTQVIQRRGGTVVRLDDLDERRAVAADPAGYLRELPRPVLIDEYQYVPDVLWVIKAELSKAPGVTGDWLLCGSVSVDALTAAADSLGGRLSDVGMGTLTLDERRDLPAPAFLHRLLADGPGFLAGWHAPVRLGRTELLEEARCGGFPLAVAEHRRGGSARRVMADWVSAAVIADGASIGGVRNTEELRRMLRLYAASTATITPKDRPTADRLEIHRVTVARYRSLLADLHVTWDLPALVPGNARGQVTKSPKLHLIDSGLASHLAGRDAPAILDRDPSFAGAVVETMVANDLRVQAECLADPVRLYHYREDDNEVDLVIEGADGRLTGIEVKLTADPGAGATRGLAALRRSAGDRFAGGVVLARVPAGRDEGGFTIAPIDAVWYAR